MNSSDWSRADWRIYFAVFLGSGFLCWASLFNDDWKDQCIQLLFGERILHGEVPYRDFFEFILPGSGYATAAWFLLFGDSMESVRVLMAALGAATITLAYDISRTVVTGALLWIGPIGVFSAFIVGNQGIGHMVFALPVALASIAFALRADRSGSTLHWFLAALLAAASGLFTQSIGAWLGLAIFVAAMTARLPLKRKLLHGGVIVLGAVAVLLPMFLLLWTSGAWKNFRYDVLVWTVDRYLPFHAAGAWGAWLPEWKMLEAIPKVWWAVWISALSMVWGSVWILPFALVYPLIQWIRSSEPVSGRRILFLACAAMVFSVFPNGGAMRMVRLSTLFWPLIALELHLLLPAPNGLARLAVSAFGIFLLLGGGVQWSYEHQLITLDTPRGRARVHEPSAEEYVALTRHFKPGQCVLMLPDVSSATYFYRLNQAVPNDHQLIPILFTTSQLRQFTIDLREKNFPPVVVMQGHFEDKMAEFKPTKYLDEAKINPLRDYIAEQYSVQFQETFKFQKGDMVGLTRKP